MKLSVIIPARNEQFLGKTVEDILNKATGDIEIFTVLEGYWTPLVDDKRVHIIHFGEPHGMRAAINAAVRICNGDYIMKTDAHCMFAQGFDEQLIKDSEDNWLSIPQKYSLDAENWTKFKEPVQYYYLTSPEEVSIYGKGLHGRIWDSKHQERKDYQIDDLMSFQGSCWFMPKKLYEDIDYMDETNTTPYQEAQELGNKVWLSGGRVIINKNTWYAHLHKGKKYGRGYNLPNDSKRKYEDESMDFWLNNKWSKQVRNFDWLIEKFNPPGWENWSK
jgi:glycosyltransferase involved in cell wall biosynthesis